MPFDYEAALNAKYPEHLFHVKLPASVVDLHIIPYVCSCGATLRLSLADACLAEVDGVPQIREG